jgi:hypothetical protein
MTNEKNQMVEIPPLLLNKQKYADHLSICMRELDTLILQEVIPVIRFGKKCVRIPWEMADRAVLKLAIEGRLSDYGLEDLSLVA